MRDKFDLRIKTQDLRIVPVDLKRAILSFKFDPVKHDYCGDCANDLVRHLKNNGFAFEHHAHGHSFVGNDEFILDLWPLGHPRIWRLNDPMLKGSVYETLGDHNCWCQEAMFESQQIRPMLNRTRR